MFWNLHSNRHNVIRYFLLHQHVIEYYMVSKENTCLCFRAACSLDVSARHHNSCGQYKYCSRVSPDSRSYVRVLGRRKMSVRVGVDVTGLQVTFSNPKVLPLLNRTIHALVSTNGNPLSSLEQAVSLDKQFLFGEILVVS